MRTFRICADCGNRLLSFFDLLRLRCGRSHSLKLYGILVLGTRRSFLIRTHDALTRCDAELVAVHIGRDNGNLAAGGRASTRAFSCMWLRQSRSIVPSILETSRIILHP
jgi:hypothetical protein